MATPDQLEALLYLRNAAVASGHIWPKYAAAEGVLETGWGTSQLFVQANNVFGQKQSSSTPMYGTVSLPSQEFVRGRMVVIPALWVKFPTIAESFEARMRLLVTTAALWPNYALALAATNGVDFITLVSKTWSTDPDRAEKVLEIYSEHEDVLNG